MYHILRNTNYATTKMPRWDGTYKNFIRKSLRERMNSEVESLEETSDHHQSLISSLGESKRRFPVSLGKILSKWQPVLETK